MKRISSDNNTFIVEPEEWDFYQGLKWMVEIPGFLTDEDKEIYHQMEEKAKLGELAGQPPGEF